MFLLKFVYHINVRYRFILIPGNILHNFIKRKPTVLSITFKKVTHFILSFSRLVNIVVLMKLILEKYYNNRFCYITYYINPSKKYVYTDSTAQNHFDSFVLPHWTIRQPNLSIKHF